MKRKLMAAAAACAMLFASMGAVGVEASFLGDVLGSVGHSFSSSSRHTQSSRVRAERWTEVYANDRYTLYLDTSTVQIRGSGDHWTLEGWFKRVFTPEGSRWLGTAEGSRVAPGVVAYSQYKALYKMKFSSLRQACKYYDASGQLVCNYRLADLQGEYDFGNYEPENENEQIRDALLRATGSIY